MENFLTYVKGVVLQQYAENSTDGTFKKRESFREKWKERLDLYLESWRDG